MFTLLAILEQDFRNYLQSDFKQGKNQQKIFQKYKNRLVFPLLFYIVVRRFTITPHWKMDCESDAHAKDLMRIQKSIYHKNELQGSVSTCKSWIWDARMMNVIHNYFKDTFKSALIPRLLPNISLPTFFIKITNLLLFPSLNNLILLCFSTINDGFELCFHISTHLCLFNWLNLICILKPWCVLNTILGTT